MSTDRIVVGVDGSEPASRAVDWALSWAGAVGAPVTILASEAVPPGKTAESPGLGEKAQRVITTEMERLGEAAPDVDIEARALVAHPVTALLGASAEAGAVVVGTRGAGALQGTVIGSISGAVAASAQSPTVVLSPHTPAEFDADGPIVVGFDGDEPSLGAARLAIRAAQAEGRIVRLLHARTADGSEEAEPLDALVDQLRAEHAGVEIELSISEESAVDALTAASQEAAFVVLASQGHRGVPRFLLGSTTRALVQTSQAPVIVLTARSMDRPWPVRRRS